MTHKLQLEETIDSINRMASEKEELAISSEGPVPGRYGGLPVQFERSMDDRSGTLLRAISYFAGQEEREWDVPQGAWLDGASIPRPFWSIIGGPYTGKYFPASVVHDHFCIVKTRKWQDTHRMFHAAMRTSGVGRFKAKIMFYSVFRFGPRWQVLPSDDSIAAESALIAPEALNDDKAASIFNDVAKLVEQDMALEEIEQLAGQNTI